MGLLSKILHSHSYGKLEPDGVQYCTVCGAARYVESPCKNGKHLLEDVTTFSIITAYGKHQSCISQRCKRCGIRKTYNEVTGVYGTNY